MGYGFKVAVLESEPIDFASRAPCQYSGLIGYNG